MIRVPGSKSSLNKEKVNGANVRVIYSPLDCLDIANKNRDKEIVFLGIGFETTSPAIALTIKNAYESNISNFSVLTSIKTMPNAIEKLIQENTTDEEIFIIGGAETYKQLFNYCSKIYATAVYKEYPYADTSLDLDVTDFNIIEETEVQEHEGLRYNYVTLERNNNIE